MPLVGVEKAQGFEDSRSLRCGEVPGRKRGEKGFGEVEVCVLVAQCSASQRGQFVLADMPDPPLPRVGVPLGE